MSFDDIAEQVLHQAIESVRHHVDADDYTQRLQTKIREHFSAALKQSYKDAIYCFATHRNGELVVGSLDRPYRTVISELDRIGGPFI